MKNISQREARRLRKRVSELEKVLRNQRDSWARDWGPEWVQIDSFDLAGEGWATVQTARKLGHALVLVPSMNKSTIYVYADNLERTPLVGKSREASQ